MDTINHRRFGVLLFGWIAVVALMPRLACAAPDIELQMTVDVAVPSAGQPVQFTVIARNIGVDAATSVQITDQLPAELAIPAGMAAFPSTGTYDAATGAWLVGSLAAGASATLVIPAIVTVANQPSCSVNVARVSSPADADTSNNRASAAVRRNAADRCVDLFVVVENQLILGCVTSNMVRNVVRVGNLGPDLATSVFVDLTQNPAIAPSLRLVNPGASAGVSCTGTRCTIASVAAGTRIDLQAESGSFRNEVQQAPILSASVSGSEPDFATANNQSSIVDVFPPVSSRCSGINVDGGPVAISCFIATAAYGSALEPHVTALREFRDRYLQRSALGRAFIRFYYRHSPPIAAIIARHDSLRFVVRMLLAPLVFTVAFPWRALALMAVSAVLFIGWRRRYKASER